ACRDLPKLSVLNVIRASAKPDHLLICGVVLGLVRCEPRVDALEELLSLLLEIRAELGQGSFGNPVVHGRALESRRSAAGARQVVKVSGRDIGQNGTPQPDELF